MPGTLTLVSTMPNPTVFGQTVSLTANVVALGPGTPTGTVTFNISGGPTLTAPLVGGKATTATAGLTAGPHLVTATYSGNGTFSSSTGSTIQAVVQAGTRTTLTTSPNPSQPGQPVTLTATVAAVPPGAGTPTGNVTFYVVGGPILTAPLVGGQAAATTTALGTGPRTIVATYTGDPNFFPSADTGIHTSLPGRTASTTTVSPSPNPSVPGQAVTFTATVAPAGPGGGTPTGTVTFTISGGPTLTAPVVAGRATVTTSALTPGPHTVTAQYSGDGAFNPSTGTMTQTVDRASTTTTVTSSPDPSVAGQSVTLTANVAPVAPGSGTPTGTVTFVIDGGAPMTAPLVGGQASVSTSALGVGSHTVTATYGGDASFAPSTGNDTQTVQAQPVTATTTAVTSSPDPSVVGQAVTFAATVAPVDPGSGTPTGSVTFDFGDGTAAVTVALSGGTATVAHTYAAAGSPYLVRASYSGSATFSSSIGIDPHTVQPRTATATRTTVTSSPDPSAAGQSVTFTANVSPVAPGTGAPTRTVIFDFGDGSTATVALSGSSATITHAYASAAGSPYQVRATYSGSPVFGPSTGTDTQSVTRVSTTTTVTSSPDPSVAGQPVTFTATVAPVAPGTGTPTGTVTFAFGDGSTGTGTLSGGTATVTHAYVSSTGSPFTVTATYGGSAAFASSTGSDSQTVSRVSTTTVVSSAPDPSVVGELVSFTATVAPVVPGSGTPTGSVTFAFGDGTAPVTATLSGGTATVTHAYVSSTGSPFTVTATYGGSAAFASSTGSDSQTVSRVSTTTVVSSAPDPSVVGELVSFTATVAPVVPGSGTPTGSVTFAFGDGAAPVTATLSGGTATVTHTYSTVTGSPFGVTATYSGSAAFEPSAGSDTQTVSLVSTTTAVTSAPDPSVAGQQVTISATVAPVAPGTGTPTGTVTFDFGDGTAPVTAMLSGGTATVPHTYPTSTGSPYTVAVTYSGDTTFGPSTGTDTQTVSHAASTTTVVTSPGTALVGRPVTFNAAVSVNEPGAGTPTGTVTFDFGDGTSTTAQLADGIASVTHTYASAGGSPFTVTANYSGDGDFDPSTGTDIQVVNRGTTTTTVLTSPDPSVTGESVTVTATVEPGGAGFGGPTGTVTLDFGDGSAPATATLSDGVATVTHAYTDPGASPFTVVATYDGDDAFEGSSDTDAHSVNPALTATTVSSAPDPSTVGEDVTFTATVAVVAAGAGTPTGTVTFTFGDGTPSVTVPVEGSQATLTHSFTGASGSPFTVTAHYDGDTGFSASAGTDTQTVQPVGSSLTVTVSPDTPVTGQPVTVTATVTPDGPGAGTPTGTVTVDFGDGTPPVVVQLAGGQASATHAYADAAGGPYPITVTYSGDANVSPATATLTQTVTPSDTTTAVISSPEPSPTGVPVTVIATVAPVAPGTGMPTGTVTLDFGDGSSPEMVTLSGGVATTTHTYTEADGSPYTITAVYNGDAAFTTSTGTVTHAVDPEIITTTTTVASVPDPSDVGHVVMFTATVTPDDAGSGTPTGTVTFTFGDGTPQQTLTLSDGNASATHTYSDAAGSPYTVIAVYSGVGEFSSSTGTDTHSVNPAPTTLSVLSAPDPSETGESVTFTATVASDVTGPGTPGGTVVFDFGDGTASQTAELSDGQATVTHTYTDAADSPYLVTASYGGNAGFAPASGSDIHVVNTAAATISVVSSPDPSVSGQDVTILATVTPSVPGADAPTGTVTFTFGDGTPSATVPVDAGQAGVAHAYAGADGSPYTISAVYSGDSSFSPATAADTHTVQQAATVTTLSASPDPSVVGQPVTVVVTASVNPDAPGAGMPTGTVTFRFGDGSPPVIAQVSGGVATAEHTYTTTTGSPFAITATYDGDANFSSSTDSRIHEVHPAGTTTMVTSSPDPSRTGEPVVFTATVAPQAPGTGTPTGTVTFNFGDGSPPATVDLTGGTATAQHAYADVPGSPYSVVAVYNGEPNYSSSTGTDTQTVEEAATATTLTFGREPSTVGEPVTFTVSVAPEAPGGGTPAGSVTVDFGDGSPQQTVELVGGQATVTHPYTDASGSPYTVTATYVGSSGYATSTVSGTHTVDAAPTDTLLVTSPDPSQAAGSGAIFTAVVTAELPEAGTPTGTVTFTFGDGTPPVTEPLTGGVATTDHSYASIIGSPYPVSAAYGGTENFTGSSDSDTHRVELQVSTSTTTVTTAPASPIAGEPVTFTVTVTADAPGAPLPTGSVTFTFGDSTEPVTVPLSDGLATATHAYPTTAGNPYTVVAAYSGDTTLSSSTGFGTVTVQPVASTTAVSSGPEPSVVGQEVTFTATVAPQAPGVVQPTGTVTFDFGDGSAPATVSLVAGVAAVAHAFTSVADPLVVTASYSGDADTLASTGTDTQTVQQAASSMQVTTSPNPSVSGEPLTFTAVITPVPPGAGAPGGSVTFDFGDGTPPVVAEVSGGVATITHAYTGTAASPYTATAVYSGNAQFTAAAATVTHALQPALSATVLSSVPDPSVTGEPVTFTATVTTQAPGTGIPTGTVTFTFGDGTAPVTQPLSGGVATATHAYARASDTPYGVVAVYSGDADVTSSTAKDTQTVTPAGTSTTVTTSPDPSVPGQPVDVTVLVAPLAPGAGTPTGTVVLDFGDGSSLETVTLSGGVATVSHTWATTAGSPYTVSVTYSGDADFSTSTGADSHTVQPATSTVLVTSSPDPSVPGQPVDVTVLVAPLAPGAGTPTGTVVLDFGDGSSLETVTLSGGVATVSHTWATTAGSPYTVTVTYGGDADFSGATGTDTHALQRAATSTLVASSPDPSVTGQPMTVIATVVPLAPGDGVPTGSVTFTFGDGTPPQTVELTDGLASVAHTYSDAAGSPYPVMAAYDGDADFGSSTGNDTHTVQQAATTTTVASSPDPSVVGQQVTVTATVVPQDPGSGTPTGTVTFDFGDGTPTVTATPVDGVAGVSHTYQSAAGSPYTVTATYSGDTGFVYSTSTDTQSVQPASTTTLVTTSPEPSEPGQQVTLTAVVTPESPEAGVPTGTVTFTFGDVGAPVTATLSGGVATTTHTYASTAGSPFAVTASYNGSDSFTGSSDSDTHRVELEVTTTTTTVTSAPDPSVVGQPVTFTATVGPDTVGAPTPTGTVTFTYGDGSPSDIVPLTGGVATAAHPYTTTNGSPFAVTAFYNGDATSSTSTGTDTQTVGRASTTTQLVSSPDPSVVGQTVSFTATVASGAPGAGTPAGTVTFDFGDGSETVTKSTAGGVATAQHVYSATSGSPFTATATYNPDTDFSGSTGTDTHTVQPAATTTTVVSSPDASQSGQPMTVTATVAPEAPGAGTPTGTVTFSFGDGTPSATATLNGGVATVTHAYSGAGGSPYSITASYAGNSAFAASTGIDTHSVQQAATTTTAVTAPDPSLSGQLVTATATVAPEAPGAGTPTGTVTFSFGSGSAPVTATLSGGVAVAAYTYSSPGGSPYPVTAVYGGSVDFGSSAGTDTQTVNRASTTTQLTSAPDPSVTGQLVTFTATVRPTAPGSGTPSGTVTFTFGDGSAPVTAALNGGVATATRTYTAASTGPFTATATYGGSAEFLGSTATDTQTVNRASTSTTVVSSPDPSQSGQTATFTATVAPVSPGAGTPTGTVTFTISNGPTLTATLVGGKATVTSSTLSAGAHTVTATYSGSASFAASTGTDTHSVGRPSTTTTVVSAPDPSAAGQNTTFTVTVTPVPPATGTPTGTVTIFIIRGPNPTVTLVNGRATYTTSTLSPGAHAVVATYSGDTNYASSEGIDTHFVKTD